MKIAAQGILLGIVHFIATYLLTFAAGVGSQNPLVKIGAKVLGFPLSILPSSGDGSNDNQALGWFFIVAQSLVWGFGLAYLIRLALAAKSAAQ